MTEQVELDVHLRRDGDDSWGFRLIGGKDFSMPLTIVKVVPRSPAEKAGLCNGDVVCRINDSDTCDLSHSSAKEVVDNAEQSLSLAVKRGLYDPVLDDYEPIYEPVDQEDFDQPSQPTEVQTFQIQQFLDPKQHPEGLPEKLPELRDIETPGVDAIKLIESRSLTASPFVLPTKPYRPFSTEPLPEVPPLENPIILNSNYNDLFGKLQDGEIFPETRYKLPISEQYDPDGSKKRTKEGRDSKIKEIRFSEQSIKKDVTYEERVKEETKISKEMQHKTIVGEMKFMEKMKKEIDLDKIEMTAVSLVDDSIERAVSVADEIKKEIDIELSESVVSEKQESISAKTSKTQKESTSVVSKISSENVSREESELVEMIDKTTKEIINYNGSKSEVSVAKEVSKFETNDKKQVKDNSSLSKQEIEETIVHGSVRRKSEAFDKTLEEKSVDTKQSLEKKIATERSENKENKLKIIAEQDIKNQAIKVESTAQSQKTNEIKKESISQKTDANLSTDTKTTSKHVAYTIGLKTIPNIKGTIHSSYHYNLLLKTFFIHLTDVMVALSRFILTEPVFDRKDSLEVQGVTTESASEHISSSRKEYLSEETLVHDIKEKQKETYVSSKQDLIQENTGSKKEDKAMAFEKACVEKQEIASSAQELVQGVIEYAETKEDIKENLEVERALETRILSGAKMAQLTERKSEELTQKMDAVITEFQVKAGIEETVEARERSSRSRSRIEEEVALESDPLEWLSKVDKNQSQEITELKSESKLFSSTSESIEEKIVESKHEKRGSITSKTKEGKQMYVAIVESHVFTNKDAIFEEQALEFSETSSVQSADETNVAFVGGEAIATEQVALESKSVKREEAKSVLEESRELAIVNAHSESVQIAEEVKAIEEEVQTIQTVDVGTKTIQEVVVQEIVQPMVDLQEIKTVEIEENLQKVNIKKEEHVMTICEKSKVAIEEARHEMIEMQESKREEKAIAIKEEEHLFSICENIKVAVEDKKHEVVVTAEQQAVKEEEQIMIISEKDENQDVAEEKAVVVNDIKLKTEVDTTKKDIDIDEPVVEKVVTESRIIAKPAPTVEEASAQLQIVKEQILEVEQTLQLTKESDISINKQTEILEFENNMTSKHKNTSKTFEVKDMIQESTFTARSSRESKKLSLNLDLAEQRRLQSQSSIQSDPPSTIDTPTPATVPPTPLTDEYVFKLQIPLPKVTTLVPREVSPDIPDCDHEDPNIVKKRLVAHIETTISSPIIYDPPLASPPLDIVQSPVYTKPGLKGGSGRPEFSRRKEEILEIERKSSLLASAIDETIKCIEEYKEEVGIETKKVVKFEELIKTEKNNSTAAEEYKVDVSIDDQPIIYNGYAKVEANDNHTKVSEEWNQIDKQVIENNKTLNELSKTLNIEVTEKTNVKSHTEMQAHEKSSMDLNLCSLVDSNENKMNQFTNGISLEDSNKSVDVILNGFDVQTEESAVLDCDKPIQLKTIANIDTSLAKYQIEEIESKNKGVHEDTEVKKEEEKVEKRDPLEGYRPVQFNPEELIAAKRNLQSIYLQAKPMMQREASPGYMDARGELLGTRQGIVDGLEEAVVDADVAKELGKPGITENKIAELISGESEMLREAHVMGLSRVLSSHMNRPDDSSVDFKKIKPIIDSLRDSEVLKALNDELIKTREEKKKEERKWTKFLQKPSRPVPRVKFGYYGYMQQEENIEEPYKVKIVKQPKPKVAPDYKSEDFETGPLPWEERALNEPPPPPVDPEDPILIPEEVPEFLEAVDPLPESEVPDLEETDIPLPPPKAEEPEPSPEPTQEEAENEVETPEEQPEESNIEAVVEETEHTAEEMEQNRLAEQLLTGVQNMVDPNASVDQQLSQMRAQLAALAQLPGVIQQTLELVTKQLSQLAQQEIHQPAITEPQMEEQPESQLCVKETQPQTNSDVTEESVGETPQTTVEEVNENITPVEQTKPSMTQEEMEKLKKEEEEMLEEQRRIEKQKKIENWNEIWPWGNAKSYCRQYRINFMKYEKPPVSLDHLQQSEVYKLVHNMEQAPVKRVDMLTPVVAEADYREKCRSMTPSSMDNHTSYPQQVHP